MKTTRLIITKAQYGHWQLVFTLLALVSLSACVTNQNLDLPNQDSPDVEDRIIIDGEALPLPDDVVPSAKALDGGRPMSPVVKSLLMQSRDQRRIGKWDVAAMLLERALRIEPRNATVWSRLANVRFDQQLWRKAIQLSAKSNTLAANDVGLKRRNWMLMANSYEKLENSESALKYLNKLNQ